ncbi:cleft lip and palate transmembrane protein 1-like protein isoform X2 [Varroa jacobsoni]|nr:cleft lip and palate transmembrane protein 1-like protein isoform X2 [Varroa jacobsoni]
MVVTTEETASRIKIGKHQIILNEADFDVTQTTSDLILKSFDVPLSVRRNGSLYLHVFLDSRTPSAAAKEPLDLISSSTATAHSVRLSRYAVPKPEAVSLIGGNGKEPLSDEERSKAVRKRRKASMGSQEELERPYTHLPSTLTVCLMATPHSMPINSLFSEIIPLLKLTHQNKYVPIAYVNTAAVMNRDLVHITPSTSTFGMKVSFNQITVGKLKFISVVKEALNNMEQFGISEQDTDGVKTIFFDTSLVLLLTTVLVSALHMIFDVMAFKNDVSFWRNIDNFEGISVRAIGWRALSQIVILLYLYDNDTSRLVLLSNLVSTAIELWKLAKAMKVSICWKKILPVGFKFGSSSEAEQKTDEIDSQGMKLLSYILLPLSIGGAIYSLYYQPHKSWYSWSIASLANGVYAFGFLLMLPQLFLNYRLKSVAHLPWRVFMYKAFNTFIDDLFAFIIHMPTAHRVACFRDDAVFLIFLYQRWLYPVDKTRVNEFGMSYAIDETSAKCSPKKNVEESKKSR